MVIRIITDISLIDIIDIFDVVVEEFNVISYNLLKAILIVGSPIGYIYK